MKERIVTALVAGIVFVLFAINGGVLFTLLMASLATIAIAELLKMKKIAYLSPPGGIAFLLTWFVVIPDDWLRHLTNSPIDKVDSFLFALLLLLSLTVVSKNKFSFDDISFVLMSSLYAGFGFYYMAVTRLTSDGLPVLFFVLILIWTTDSGAYFIGKSVGKKKLWPDISPNKTIEGAIGGILSALLISILFQIVYPLFDLSHALLISLVTSVFAQVGDLVESALKRHYDVKDSGQLLPGHGGILDRCDSWIFVFPILHLFQLI